MLCLPYAGFFLVLFSKTNILTEAYINCIGFIDILPSVGKFTGSLIHGCIQAKTLNHQENNSRTVEFYKKEEEAEHRLSVLEVLRGNV